MADKADVWLKMIEHQWAQARQSETIRAQATTFIIALVSALQGIIVQREFDKPSYLLAFLMFLLGLYGLVLAAKLYERFRNATHRIGALRRQLDAADESLLLDETEKLADEKHSIRFRWLSKIRLHGLWNWVFGIICLLAVINAVLIWTTSQKSPAGPANVRAKPVADSGSDMGDSPREVKNYSIK
jgi:hypothetical protein